MAEMSVLVVDDEPLARQRLIRLIEGQEGYRIVGEADNGSRALKACAEHKPDIVLMDIRMPEMDGLEAAQALAEQEAPPAVIFCTAYDDYAIEAFSAQAMAYLLKPVNRDKLGEALATVSRLNKVQLKVIDELAEPEQKEEQTLKARNSRGVELIPLAEVRYFLADHKYVSAFFLREGCEHEAILDESLKELEHRYGDALLRIHRNALVAKTHIQGLVKEGDVPRLQLAGLESGPQVSRRHLAGVRRFLSTC